MAERRDLRAEEMQVIAGLASRYSRLEEVERELSELQNLKREVEALRGRPWPPLHPRMRDVLELNRRGIIADTEVRAYLGLPPPTPWWRQIFASGAP